VIAIGCGQITNLDRFQDRQNKLAAKTKNGRRRQHHGQQKATETEVH